MALSEADVAAVVTAVKQSRKYRDTSEETIAALAADATRKYKSRKAVEKAVRKQLHNIMAPYLGDPDYEQAKTQMSEAFAQGTEAVKALCLKLMAAHVSTEERLPVLDTFFRQIFAVTGKPRAILDIACALDPLSLPWMGLGDETDALAPPDLQFFAIDIHEARVDFLNHFFRLAGIAPLARVQDVALQFPQDRADVALFLKEMPRFSRNYGNLGRPLLEALPVDWLVLSYPTKSAHGGRDLTERYRAFMYELLAGKDWPVTELVFEGELVFCIKKS
jgi:16S rRNA (guanine(1405)-N(7))-methyltransferase